MKDLVLLVLSVLLIAAGYFYLERSYFSGEIAVPEGYEITDGKITKLELAPGIGQWI